MFNYLSSRVNHNNFEVLTNDLNEMDDARNGVLDGEMFIRCLSKNAMKMGPAEQEKLIETLKEEGSDEVNYQDFLKFSYLTHLFMNHCLLEHAMRDKD